MKYTKQLDQLSLARMIIEERMKKGYAAKEIAGMLGISAAHYCNIEKGKYPLRVTHLKILTDLYKRDFLHDL